MCDKGGKLDGACLIVIQQQRANLAVVQVMHKPSNVSLSSHALEWVMGLLTDPAGTCTRAWMHA